MATLLDVLADMGIDPNAQLTGQAADMFGPQGGIGALLGASGLFGQPGITGGGNYGGAMGLLSLLGMYPTGAGLGGTGMVPTMGGYDPYGFMYDPTYWASMMNPMLGNSWANPFMYPTMPYYGGLYGTGTGGAGGDSVFRANAGAVQEAQRQAVQSYQDLVGGDLWTASRPSSNSASSGAEYMAAYEAGGGDTSIYTNPATGQPRTAESAMYTAVQNSMPSGSSTTDTNIAFNIASGATYKDIAAVHGTAKANELQAAGAWG